MAGGGIFISYRRSDTASLAGRIHERMTGALPRRRVFLDVSSITPGVNFEQSIEKELEKADVILVLIGSSWLAADEGEQQPRIWDEEDYVRLEIGWALKHDRNIIPVLVDNAKMPDASELPADIRELAKRNAAEIRNSRFDDDFDFLLRAVDGDASSTERSKTDSLGKRMWPAILGALSGLVLLITVLSVHEQLTGLSMSAHIGLLGSILLIPVFLFAGGYIGSRFFFRRRSR